MPNHNQKYILWQGCGKIGTLAHCWSECEVMPLLGKITWRFLKNLKVDLPYDPTIPLLSIYPKEFSARSRRNLHTQVLIVRNNQEVEAAQMYSNEWINKMWYMHIMKYYPSFKRKDIPPLTCYMDGPWRCYAKKNKSITKRQILYYSTYLRYLK